jgi:hypothetical protein
MKGYHNNEAATREVLRRLKERSNAAVDFNRREL